MGQQGVPAVITPVDDHMGLDIARSLAKRGVRVLGLDHDPGVPGRHSRCLEFTRCPDPNEDEEGFVAFLIRFADGLRCKPVLFPLSDRHALVCSAHRDSLRGHYEFVMPDHRTMVALATKDGLLAAAREFGIPAPRTVPVAGPDELKALAPSLSFPVLLKPTESTYWQASPVARALRSGLLAGQPKVRVCRDAGELLEEYRRIAAYDNRLLVQEVVPGEDDRLAYFCFYLDRGSRPLGFFAGRKCRVLPTGFGSASFVRGLIDPRLNELSFRLLSGTRYQGLGGIEFKMDPRDGEYKLIEFNTRFGMWDGLAERGGVDLAGIAYDDALGRRVEPRLAYRDDVAWIDCQRDFRAFLEYRRRGRLSLGGWRRSLKGRKMWAIYSREDWRPGLALTLRLARKLLDRMMGKAATH